MVQKDFGILTTYFFQKDSLFINFIQYLNIFYELKKVNLDPYIQKFKFIYFT